LCEQRIALFFSLPERVAIGQRDQKAPQEDAQAQAAQVAEAAAAQAQAIAELLADDRRRIRDRADSR